MGEDRPCNQCIWKAKDECTVWDCDPITRKEVRELLHKNEKDLAEAKAKISQLEKENVALTELHYADQAEIMYQRRQIDFLMEVK